METTIEVIEGKDVPKLVSVPLVVIDASIRCASAVVMTVPIVLSVDDGSP